MRRYIIYCLTLLLSVEVADAQTQGGRAGGRAGGGRIVISPPTSEPPRQDSPAAEPPVAEQPRDRPQRPPAGDHGGRNPDHWRRHRPPNWNHRPGWNNGLGWGWYLPPVFVSPSFHEFGYTFTLPYVDPVPAADPLDWLAPAPDPAAIAPVPAPADPAPPGRISSPEQKARAGRYVSYGDKLFAQQKYLAALGRYKSATEAASDMAEAHLRQGFAYVAMGQFESASKALRRGLALRSNWQGTAFRLSTLYDGAEAAKTQHIEKLALAVEENPFDSGLLMTLGVELFFDGQFDRAELCFQNAARLGGGDEALVADFLPGATPAGVPAKTRKVTF